MIDFGKWAVMSHKDDTGLGRCASDLRRVLGLGRHLVTPSDRLVGQHLSGEAEIEFRSDFTDEQVRAAFEGLRGIILVERFWWHPRLLSIAREMGILTIAALNWEWFTGWDEQWKLVDALVCPTYYAVHVVRKYGFKSNSVFIPYGVDTSRFPAREINGPARLFVHNAGIVEADDRKGTGDTIRAFKKTRRDDIRLIVRMQNEASMPKPDSRIEIRIGNLPDSASLYLEGDCAIQPSRMEGIGFMILEPLAAGLPVITTNYPPMNEYVRDVNLLASTRLFKRKAFPSQWVKHAHLRLADVSDLTRKIEWCASNDLSALSHANRVWSEQRYDPKRLSERWAELVEALYTHRLDAYVKSADQQDEGLFERPESALSELFPWL